MYEYNLSNERVQREREFHSMPCLIELGATCCVDRSWMYALIFGHVPQVICKYLNIP